MWPPPPPLRACMSPQPPLRSQAALFSVSASVFAESSGRHAPPGNGGAVVMSVSLLPTGRQQNWEGRRAAASYRRQRQLSTLRGRYCGFRSGFKPTFRALGRRGCVLRSLVRLVESVVCHFRRVFRSGRWAWLPQFRTRTRYNEILRVVYLLIITCWCLFPFCLFVCFKPVISCSSGSSRWRWATSISPKLNSLWRWATEWWLKENAHNSQRVTRHYGAISLFIKSVISSSHPECVLITNLTRVSYQYLCS